MPITRPMPMASSTAAVSSKALVLTLRGDGAGGNASTTIVPTTQPTTLA
jgi:hypothetical protein